MAPAMKPPFCVLVFAAVFLCTWSYFAPSARGADSPNSYQEASAQSADLMTLSIPGPLRSFLRMAGISQKISPEEVAPLLARNVFQRGYAGPQPYRRPTEFLVLLIRYVQQARELSALAGPDGVLRVSNCEEARPLLRVLGYRTRADCGQHNIFLQTDDPQRAFLTVDSGFPLPRLEQSLRDAQTFTYAFAGTSVPALLADSDWLRKGNAKDWDLLDALLRDPALARFYCAFARMDSETQVALRQTQALKKIIPLAAILDFYGSYIRIRSGRVEVPGGSGAESAWKGLVGSSPESPADFVLHLLAKDNGWLAAYFDSLSRIPPEQQAHFVELPRLRRCYESLRGKNASPSAMASVFRPDPDLLVLMTRLQWQPNGDPRVPGNLEVWKSILGRKAASNIDREWGVRVNGWNDPEGLLEALFALSRAPGEGGPTEVFLALSELDGRRPAEHRLSPQTIELTRRQVLRIQGSVFDLFRISPVGGCIDRTVFEDSLVDWKDLQPHVCGGTRWESSRPTSASGKSSRARVRFRTEQANDSWRRSITPFATVSSPTQLFDAGRALPG